MAAWDTVQTIGPPSLIPPKVDFSPLGELGNAYYKGQEQQQQQALRNVFSEGFPKDAKGQPDYAAAAEKLFRLGAVDQGQSLLRFQYGIKGVEALGGVRSPYDTGGGGPDSGASPPSMQPQQAAPAQQGPTSNLTGPNTETTVGPAQTIPPSMTTTQAVDNVNRTGNVVPPQSGPAQPGGPAQPSGPAAGVGPAPIVDPRVPPARLVQAAQATPAQRSAAAGMVPAQYRGNELAFVQRALAQATKIDQAIAMGGLGGIKLDEAKATADSYRQAAYKVMDALAPTPAMREAVASGQANPLEYSTEQERRKAAIASGQPTDITRTARDAGFNSPLEYQAELKRRELELASAQPTEQMRLARDAGFKSPQEYQIALKRQEAEIASAQPTETTRTARDAGYPGPVEYQGALKQQEATIAARQHEEQKTADTLEKLTQKGIDAKTHSAKLEAVDTLGQKVGYGVIPKIQSYLGARGIDTAGLSDIQAYERAIDFLAPQLRPEGSGRLMQSELTAFKAALGGLMTTPQGRKISVQNLKLVSDFDQKVGDIARDTSLTPAERTKKIYALPPPRLQTTLLPVGAVRMGNGGIKYKFTGGDPNAPGGTTWEPITTAQEVGRWRGAQP